MTSVALPRPVLLLAALLLLLVCPRLRAQNETWGSQDIGSPLPAGSSAPGTAPDSLVLRAGGTDIWNVSDSFHLLSRPLAGDAVLTVRVLSVSNSNSWAKAGLMVRSSADPASPHVSLFATPTVNGVAFQRRLLPGAASLTTAAAAGPFAPVWLRFIVTGDIVTAYRSADGVSWIPSGFDRLPPALPGQPRLAGLALCSHNQGRECAATFSALALDALPAPPPGSGLAATYYDNADFTAPVLSRTDPSLFFDWGSGSPAPAVAPDTFSVRWSGFYLAETAGLHTLATDSDDGVRLWLDGQLLIDQWNTHAVTRHTASVTLQPGPHRLVIEYYENTGLAVLRLLHAPPGALLQPVPSRLLLAPAGPMMPDSPTGLRVLARTDRALALGWLPAPGGVGPTTYQAVVPGRLPQSTARTFLTLPGLAPGADAGAAVLALDAAGAYSPSATPPPGQGSTLPAPALPAGSAHPRPSAPPPLPGSSASGSLPDIAPGVALPTAALPPGPDIFTLAASGNQLNGPSDQGRILTRPLQGDGSVTARILLQTDTHNWAGVTLRASALPGSPNASLLLTPRNGLLFQYRTAAGAPATVLTAIPFSTAFSLAATPLWLRLQREADAITPSWSTDGQTWLASPATIAGLPPAPLAGLVATSSDSRTLPASVFDHVAAAESPYLRVQVLLQDRDLFDDAWELLQDGLPILTNSADVHAPATAIITLRRGSTARFTIRRVEVGQSHITDEYKVAFLRPDGSPFSPADWVPRPDNSPLSGELPYQGDFPPATSQLHWIFSLPGPDTDHDGLPDGWELQYGLDPLDPSDAALDPDHDGLANLAEYQHGADPRNRDTDDDGTPDGIEVTNGTSSTDPGAGGSPAAPSDAIFTRNPDGSVTYTWKDNSNNEDYFQIVQRQPDGTKKIIARLPPNTTTYTIPAQ